MLKPIRTGIMTKSKNKKVQAFLDEILRDDKEKFSILNTMRELVFENDHRTEERMMYGGIMFSLENEDFGEVFVRKNHVSFEFIEGFLMKDPNKYLEGKGKFRRHLKIRSIDDIQNKHVAFFVKQVK